ncbi:hypothetical protein CFC21_020862 [Triticum aestivum]|uniref:Protein kinase domain-containing protein n=2 Tax=Triticum aestivum TaxID=4565 RepID=A0A9R1E8Z8_WHEAT|nr:putative serine/threonine-protein kinase-like protein CCR3 [Triticum dicoccoides]XP_037470848.1 putative serine/threonine-protein kinase-like protein CCR3 [Triticum dicoccoides]KAF7005760.1 hypothetical protein CFC21_020862 [Triticum aestivum]
MIRDEGGTFCMKWWTVTAHLWSLFQESTEVVQEVLPIGTKEFTLVEIIAATNNFAHDTMTNCGSGGRVYRGRLQNGRRVAIKRMSENIQLEDFRTELDVLAKLRHKHIIPLLGWCVSIKGKRLLTRRRKELERLILYPNQAGSSIYMLSPVTMSCNMRIDVLLRVSQAKIEYIHCHSNPRIIHRDIKSINILFDVSWVPHVSDFASSVVWDMASEVPWLDVIVRGTLGYIDLEYLHTGHLTPASDVYCLGVVMLEVLTGKRAFSQAKEEMNRDLASFALPMIEAGNIEEMLDRRPVPEPTS